MASILANLNDVWSMRPGRSRSKFGRLRSDLTAEGKVLMAGAVGLAFGAADFLLGAFLVVFFRVLGIACSGYQKRDSDSNEDP